ncbi:MAG TPA: ABC transporter ATP-binding protein [Acidimicrobiales bacterium]|nr:ABC transporter ATP-binding protein [Acidimicrobiales bacterium]
MRVLEVEGVGIRFGGVQALSNVDFRVDESEIVGILGPNGAGKTTLFNCVSGFYTPNEGRIRLHGEDVTSLRPDERAARGLGRTFQQVGLVRSFSVLENLVVAQHKSVRYGILAGLVGLPWTLREERELRRRAMRVLDFMNLGHLKDSPVGGLPYGTLKMCEVAAVLATDPDILMLDEPLAGTGPEEGEEFCARLEDMRRELGISIVMIEHHVPLVLKTADYIYVLNFGALLAEGLPDDIRRNEAVAEAYMGEGATSLA